jgi:general stress protein YciG
MPPGDGPCFPINSSSPMKNSANTPAPSAEGAQPQPPKPRGFAALTPEARQRIASAGGKASHQSGRGHEWTAEEARAAGRKGGISRAINLNKKGQPN